MLNINKEKQLFNQGHHLVAGLDEVGRGPLAGPVVAACVIISRDTKIPESAFKLIRDSKKLSAKQRDKAFEIIQELALAWSVGSVDHQMIDKINILQASFLAMEKALANLPVKPDYLLIDGKFRLPKNRYRQEAIIGGDNKIFCIAAASIIAKVTRDRFMEKISNQYPGYEFAKHKGYGTKIHLERLKELGPCPIHRLSFAPLKK